MFVHDVVRWQGGRKLWRETRTIAFLDVLERIIDKGIVVDPTDRIWLIEPGTRAIRVLVERDVHLENGLIA